MWRHKLIEVRQLNVCAFHVFFFFLVNLSHPDISEHFLTCTCLVTRLELLLELAKLAGLLLGQLGI